MHQYVDENNNYVGDLYKPNEMSIFLKYLDICNLNGRDINQVLPNIVSSGCRKLGNLQLKV